MRKIGSCQDALRDLFACAVTSPLCLRCVTARVKHDAINIIFPYRVSSTHFSSSFEDQSPGEFVQSDTRSSSLESTRNHSTHSSSTLCVHYACATFYPNHPHSNAAAHSTPTSQTSTHIPIHAGPASTHPRGTCYCALQHWFNSFHDSLLPTLSTWCHGVLTGHYTLTSKLCVHHHHPCHIPTLQPTPTLPRPTV